MLPRIIKKYPNRRLYDTVVSSYVTVDDIKQLVLRFTPFKILDAKTDEDITSQVLLQIIMEQETMGAPMFTTELLQSIIRYYGHASQQFLSQYLESSLKLFVDHQHQTHNAFKQTTPDFSAPMMEMAQKQIQLWQSMQQQLFSSLVPPVPMTSSGANPEDEPHNI